MAAALINSRLSNFTAHSAGLDALVGWPPDPHAIAIMAERNLDISHNRARQLVFQDCLASDLILVMDSKQKQLIEYESPAIRGKVFRLGEFGGFDVFDPYRLERRDFENCLDLISRGVDDWVARLK